jgi:hypothetical protein
VNQFDKGPEIFGIEPLSRFIDDHERRTEEIEGGVDQALPLAARQAPRSAGSKVLEPMSPKYFRPFVEGRTDHADLFGHGSCKNLELGRRQHESGPSGALDCTGSQPAQTTQGLRQGRLSGTIRAGEQHDLPFPNSEVDTGQHATPAAVDSEAAGRQENRVAGRRGRPELRFLGTRGRCQTTSRELHPVLDSRTEPPPRLLGDEERTPGLTAGDEEIRKLLDTGRIEMSRRFVQQYRSRTAGESRRECHTLSLARGKLGHPFLEQPIHAERSDRRFKELGVAVQAAGRVDLLRNGRQKELRIRSVETGCQEMSTLTGVEVV